MILIEFDGVTKSFSRGASRMLLRGHLARWRRSGGRQRFEALRNVSFQIREGETVGLVGPNGAGKSTLLGLVAGLAEPDQGRVRVRGRVAALLELGSGFHPELTGAENIRLNASMLGLSRERVKRVFDEMVDFAGIGEFITEPLRTYSSGMVLRLAFSVAVHVDPQILIADEVLAVGDQEFQKKSFAKILDLKRAGATILCVSHALPTIEQLCARALWLDHGRLVQDGGAAEVLANYAQRGAPAT